MSKREIQYYWLTALTLCISLIFYLNSIMVWENTPEAELIWLFKLFVSISIGLAIAIFTNRYFYIYHPFNLEKKLQKLRFRPRVSPVTGQKMHLLTEDEEDVHLTLDMIEHEKINAFEYDVWIDDSSGYKLIEVYKGNLYLDICKKCNYRTAHETKEEIILDDYDLLVQKLIKHYRCYYCDHEQTKTAKLVIEG
ncbi:hypothetical protein [Reichenbachiella versicolor]|uniref:hypothetical protein n=1 Tax=Reichenbachiella versicolor TaxID=1821036 RepID=UPI0013A5336E|nr:hypothetical protein [Reichenbachiella versicolor]